MKRAVLSLIALTLILVAIAATGCGKKDDASAAMPGAVLASEPSAPAVAATPLAPESSTSTSIAPGSESAAKAPAEPPVAAKPAEPKPAARQTARTSTKRTQPPAASTRSDTKPAGGEATKPAGGETTTPAKPTPGAKLPKAPEQGGAAHELPGGGKVICTPDGVCRRVK